MMMAKKLEELKNTGSVRFYEMEGFNLTKIMFDLENTLDQEEYAYGLEEGNKGSFVEIIRF